MPPQPDDFCSRFPVVTDSDGTCLAQSAFAHPLPRFEQRNVAERPAGEPTLAISRDGTVVFPSTDDDSPQSLPRVKLYSSKDGRNWKDVTPCREVPIDQGGVCAGAFSPDTADPMVYGDRDTGRLFNLDLNRYGGGSWISWTDDQGSSWQSFPVSGANYDQPHDHQTLFGGPPTAGVAPRGYPNLLYYCATTYPTGGIYLTVFQVQITCGRSPDGGTTWDAVASPGRADECSSANVGHGVVSRAGVLYLPRTLGCEHPLLYASEDAGQTWVRRTVNETVGTDLGNGNHGSVAVDDSGTIYFLWIDDNLRPRVAVSTDAGATWGPAMSVALPGVRMATFPSIVAGAKGRIAFQTIGTMHPFATPPGPENQTALGDELDAAAAVWHAYVSVSLDADTAKPLFVTAMANEMRDPIARGSCLGRCHGMYDFLDVEIHPVTGQVWTALVDTCVDACAKVDGQWGAEPTRGAVGYQVAGVHLR